jgi:nucleotide-binding universal stress UspA family protein
MPAADNAARIGGLLAALSRSETTLLGVSEKPEHETALRGALEAEAQTLRDLGVTPRIAVGAGNPIRQILNETAQNTYDLVVIGAERKGSTCLYWRSQKMYEVVKAIAPPVLVAMGDRKQLKRFLVCTGGKKYIAEAVHLAGKFAAAAGASVTLLHVMAEPPAMYADLVQMEEDLTRLLETKSELGLNLSRQKADLESLGVAVDVRIRHGLVVPQVFAEVQQGNYDMIVTGTSQARGIVRHYIMGDLTRSILNRADFPVLVARTGPLGGSPNIFQSLKKWFAIGAG